jgi:hypothetical protein
MIAKVTRNKGGNRQDWGRIEDSRAGRQVAFICGHCKERQGDRLYSGPAGHTVKINGRMYRAHDICMECFIYSHIPPGYIRRERYIGGNATVRPPLGVEWLDGRGPARTRTIVASGRKPRQALGW